MPAKPVIAQRTPCIVEVGPGTVYWCHAVDQHAAVSRWVPCGDGVLADGSSLQREETGGILWL
jgi:hypothetical protein